MNGYRQIRYNSYHPHLQTYLHHIYIIPPFCFLPPKILPNKPLIFFAIPAKLVEAPGIVFVHSFFMKNTWQVNWGLVPSLVGRAFLIQSVRCRTKSKKKSPSGTEITLSAIFTNKLNPSADRRFNLCAMFEQKSFARVEESTSKAQEIWLRLIILL